MKVDLTKEEMRVIDNELFVVQYKLSHLNLKCADSPPPTKDELQYKKTVEGLREKIGKLMERDAVKRFIGQ